MSFIATCRLRLPVVVCRIGAPSARSTPTMKMSGGLTRFGSVSDSKISGLMRIPRITGRSWYFGLDPTYAAIRESSVACGIGAATNSLHSLRIKNCG